MKRSTNNSDVRKLNRNRVFRFINNTEETCMSEISSALEISGPTVMSIVKELKEEGVIVEVGEYESTGGRKAKAIASVKDYCYSVGVDITQNHVGLVYTDLGREALKHERIQKSFRNTEAYFREVAEMIRDFVERNQIPEDKILGMGMSMPVIVDRETGIITNSHALGVYGIRCEEWVSYMPYPCEIMNDASAAALAEVSGTREQKSMVYLLLSNTVGGAIFIKPGGEHAGEDSVYEIDSFHTHFGDHWRSAEFGHMTLYPDGKRCYCGKQGCVDVYCSAKNLADLENGKLERFFEEMENGRTDYRKIWERYLDYVALVVDNLRMAFDCEIVLGGYVGSFMEPYMKELHSRLAPKDIFDHDGSYAKACTYQKEASAFGAALFQMEKFLSLV